MPVFVCPKCHATGNVPSTYPSQVFGTQDRDSLLRLGPFYTPCGICGKLVQTPFPCTYIDQEREFAVRLTPPGFEKTTAPIEGCRVLREADDILVFREKILLLDAGFDDRAVEILKVATRNINFPPEVCIMRMMVTDVRDDMLYIRAFGENDDFVFASPLELYVRIKNQLPDQLPDEEFMRIDMDWAQSHVQTGGFARDTEIDAQDE